MQTPPSVGVPQTSTTWSCLGPLSAGCGSMCEHNLTCSSAWSSAWLGSSSGQFRRQSWLGVRWVSDLKPYANLICGILIYELNCQGGSSVKLSKVFSVAQVGHVHAGVAKRRHCNSLSILNSLVPRSASFAWAAAVGFGRIRFYAECQIKQLPLFFWFLSFFDFLPFYLV